MKHKLFYLMVLAVTLVGIISVPVSAHTLKTDGNISVIFHTNPDDNPTSGVPSALVFFFDDSTNHFNLNNCTCNATVQENGQVIKTIPLAAQEAGYSNNPYTFPNPDVYTIQVTGEPKVANAFQSFQLSYLVRVEPGTSNENTANNNSRWRLIWIGLGTMMVAIVITALLQDQSNKRKGKKHD